MWTFSIQNIQDDFLSKLFSSIIVSKSQGKVVNIFKSGTKKYFEIILCHSVKYLVADAGEFNFQFESFYYIKRESFLP